MTILNPIKTIGGLTIYERKPKPFGATKYLVIRESDGRELEDFARYAKAVRWAKEQRKYNDTHP